MRKKKTILLLGPPPPTVGGITTYILTLINSHLNKKYAFSLYGTGRPTFGIDRSISDYTLIYRIGFKTFIKSVVWTGSHLLTYPFNVLRKHPDVIHINTASYWSFWENAIYLFVSKVFHRKTLLHIHGAQFDTFFQNSPSWIKSVIRRVITLSDKVIVLSDKWKQFFMGFIPESKLLVLNNFVNLSKFTPARLTRNLNTLHSEETLKILFLGGVSSKRKGIHVILNAVPLVLKEYHNTVFILTVIGNLDTIQQICTQQNLHSNVVLLHNITEEEKIEKFLTSDIFLLPSYAEGLPISILEAMASGLPIITTPVGGIPEVIEDGINGFLITPGDHRALAEKLLLLLSNKQMRQEMGSNNRKKIKERYDINVICTRLAQAYEHLIHAS